MPDISAADFINLVRMCLQNVSIKQLADDISADVRSLTSWANGLDLPTDLGMKRYGRRMINHTMWDRE